MALFDGIQRISLERQRQIDIEGYGEDHDDEHVDDEIAWAAVCYAAPGTVYSLTPGASIAFKDPWPWESEADKRSQHDRIRQLTVAGALIAAEIDRLLRADS